MPKNSNKNMKLKSQACDSHEMVKSPQFRINPQTELWCKVGALDPEDFFDLKKKQEKKPGVLFLLGLLNSFT